ncbi:hypothetical protein BDD12DRAFT_844639 [Trichophaea hybrida]|nr:hypothetical protein BDD12DRAFT_844639 [Trichophaea hybrida]
MKQNYMRLRLVWSMLDTYTLGLIITLCRASAPARNNFHLKSWCVMIARITRSCGQRQIDSQLFSVRVRIKEWGIRLSSASDLKKNEYCYVSQLQIYDPATERASRNWLSVSSERTEVMEYDWCFS